MPTAKLKIGGQLRKAITFYAEKGVLFSPERPTSQERIRLNYVHPLHHVDTEIKSANEIKQEPLLCL